MALTRNIDLHLLECFDVLLRERSVSRAAESLGVSQSSASEMLARLRERLCDPLLVRAREGLVPTPRALALLPEVRAAAERLRALLQTEAAFEPGTAGDTFRITTSDYTQLLLLPALTRRLATAAPGCRVDIVPVNILRAEQALDAGDVDLALAYYPVPPEGLRRSPLFTDRHVCLMRTGHPALAAPLTADAFAALSHVRVAPSGLTYFSSAVDTALEQRGLQRRISVSSPHFLMAAHLVAGGDLVLVLPWRAARTLAELHAVQVVEIPLPLPPIEIAMYWHERCHHARAQQWLRDEVRAILAPERAAAAAAA